MSSRYGRNKRRQAREQIAKLERELLHTSHLLISAQRSLATAREDGAADVLRQKHLDEAVEYMVRQLTHEYGPKLMEAANKLVASDRNRKPLDFRAVYDMSAATFEVLTIEGVIPSLHYRMRLAQ